MGKVETVIHVVVLLRQLVSGLITVKPALPVKPCLLDSPQTAVAAGKEDPRFFLLLLFSFWLCRLRFPKGRPLRRVLRRGERMWQQEHAFFFIHHVLLFDWLYEMMVNISLVMKESQLKLPGSALEPGFPTRPRALMTSTSSAPFFSTIPIWMSPK